MTIPRARLENIETKQEFLLDHDLVSIGRVADNTIVLNTLDVSRHHVHLAWNPDGYAITDLGSSYGTRVNDNALQPRVPKPLNNGDIIRIGTFELRFFTEASATQTSLLQELTRQISPRQEATKAAQFSPSVNTVVSPTATAPVLRVSTPQWNKKFPLEQNNLTLGRDQASDILIDVEVVSSKHAQLRRCDDSYEIVDLGSRNGLAFKGQRINQMRLSDGEVIYIDSDVTLTYQSTPTVVRSVPMQVLDLRGRTTLKLGRDSQNDTVIDHPSVSRFHAYIERKMVP